MEAGELLDVGEVGRQVGWDGGGGRGGKKFESKTDRRSVDDRWKQESCWM